LRLDAVDERRQLGQLVRRRRAVRLRDAIVVARLRIGETDRKEPVSSIERSPLMRLPDALGLWPEGSIRGRRDAANPRAALCTQLAVARHEAWRRGRRQQGAIGISH
jgi:hypothetical protein